MDSAANASLPLPAIDFGEDGAVRSRQFGDIYFSRAGGAAETAHVFLAGNGLPERWCAQDDFTIGELGFGTGLNFLTAWKSFLETAPAHHRLHVVSFERYPLTPDMLKQAHGDDPLAAELIVNYPLRLPGIHQLHFGRVTLTLAFGDARELLPQMGGGTIDAWFLDGFAPAKNPELWGEDIFLHLARLSSPNASVATYSAAGAVKRGLEAQGFVMEKTKGFAHKRDMLVGKRAAPSMSVRRVKNSVLIIGGGIAGCTAARALAERGLDVTLLEAGKLAQGASGNEAAVLYPQLTRNWLPATEWHFTGYDLMRRQLRRWRDAGLPFAMDSPGMVRLATDDESEARLRAIDQTLGLDPAIARWVEKEPLAELTGFAAPRGGIWFPQGTWLDPVALCRALLDHPQITVQEHCAARTLTRESDGWRIDTAQESLHASQVVLAAADGTAQLWPEAVLPMRLSAGQVTRVKAAGPLPPAIFCAKGYVIPRGDHCLIGATYDREDLSGAVTSANHARNLAELSQALPGFPITSEILDGRVSLRATTPDRLPYVGEIGPGLYVSCGHGSRGMISAPLAAEAIAAMIAGEMVPLTARLRRAVAPLRRAHSGNSSVEANPSRAKIGA